eukprot:gene4349-6733_t
MGQGAYGTASVRGLYIESRDLKAGTRKSMVDCPAVSVTVLRNDTTMQQIGVQGLADDCTNPFVTEAWVITIAGNDRFATFTATGQVKASTSLSGMRVFDLNAQSIYALYETGVVQMKLPIPMELYFSSYDPLYRYYALGATSQEVDRRSATVERNYTTSTVISAAQNGTQLSELLSNATNLTNLDTWVGSFPGGEPSGAAVSYSHDFRVAPNNYDFPFLGAPSLTSDDAQEAALDLAALLTGIYASPVGNLCTHQNEVQPGVQVGQIATTIHTPSCGYSNMYNFFDPDNYLSTAAMLWSGDSFVQEQVRLVVERSGGLLNGAGQLPHHFVGINPDYVAISGATQTGPNLFWALTALNYVKYSGNTSWLTSYMPLLRKGDGFLMSFYDTEYKMLNVPGSLMIDTFIRTEFTADTNSMIVTYWREMAMAELSLNNQSGYQSFMALAEATTEAVRTHLFKEDHLITQLNRNGTTRDFVDYDANFIACSNGVLNETERVATMARLDGPNDKCPFSHTWVSEVYYDATNCVGSNTGDSATAMGRIAWFDALSRHRQNDLAHFNDVLIGPLRDELLETTWMYERSNCNGTENIQRTPFYFEYPSVVAM